VVSNTPPINEDNTNNEAYEPCTRDLTKWGATNPTKAIKPVCATAEAVAKPMTAKSNIRKGLTCSPKLWAVASPRRKPSKSGLSKQDKAKQTSQIAPIIMQA
jgi:hypothetical protein